MYINETRMSVYINISTFWCCMFRWYRTIYEIYPLRRVTHNLFRWASIVNFNAWRYLLFVVEVITHTHTHTHTHTEQQHIRGTNTHKHTKEYTTKEFVRPTLTIVTLTLSRYHAKDISRSWNFHLVPFPFSFRCFNRRKRHWIDEIGTWLSLTEKLRSDWNNFVGGSLTRRIPGNTWTSTLITLIFRRCIFTDRTW